MSISNSFTENPLPLSHHNDVEGGEEDDVRDDISDLTFDTNIYTQSPLQRDLEQQSEVHSQSQSHQLQPHGEVELSERNMRRFGARKGYAPALCEEDSESDSATTSSSVRHGGRTAPQHRNRNRARQPPLSRRELMTRDFTKRVEDAATFDSRFYNMSTLIIVGQIVMMIIMIREGGKRNMLQFICCVVLCCGFVCLAVCLPAASPVMVYVCHVMACCCSSLPLLLLPLQGSCPSRRTSCWALVCV